MGNPNLDRILDNRMTKTTKDEAPAVQAAAEAEANSNHDSKTVTVINGKGWPAHPKKSDVQAWLDQGWKVKK